MTNKTISINPNLFSLGGSKTKKNRDKKQKQLITPLISPNVLKHKLLKRIKEHKKIETANLENNAKKIRDSEPVNSIKGVEINDINANDTFSDEFNDSISYLQTLSKQKRINDEKNNFERRKKRELEQKTLKNYSALNHQQTNTPYVNIDLPEELQHPLIKVNTENFSTQGVGSMILNTYKKDDVPYGILKGGSKPTYRDWHNKTQRNVVTNPNAALTIQGNNNSNINSTRESRLNSLREKLKQKQEQEINQKNNDVMMSQNLIQKPVDVDYNNNNNINHISHPNVEVFAVTQEKSNEIPEIVNTNIITNNAPSITANVGGTVNNEPHSRIIATKRITKKTIKRKYTLGKSKIKKSVAVLVKDRGTRKKVLAAHKDLKRKEMSDIKTYLREHNLIKIGSTAPNDVLRKLYESAMLAGEITNNNPEILLHNFSKEDKEL